MSILMLPKQKFSSMIDQNTVILISFFCLIGLSLSTLAHKKYNTARNRAYLAVMAIDRCHFLLKRIKALQFSGCDPELVQNFNAFMVLLLAKVFALNPDNQEAKDIAAQALATAEDHSAAKVHKATDRAALKKTRQQMNIAFSELPELMAMKIIPKSKLNYWRSHIKEKISEMELTFHFEESKIASQSQHLGAALNHLSCCEAVLKKARFKDSQFKNKWLENIHSNKRNLLDNK